MFTHNSLGHFRNAFRMEFVWVTSLFHILGGGLFTILALHMTIISDLSTNDER